jgi:hypothetical protein
VHINAGEMIVDIFITAYRKNMQNHNVFIGELKNEYIRDIPSPASFSSKIRCSSVKSNSIYAPAYEHFYTGQDGKFEPIFRMSVATKLRTLWWPPSPPNWPKKIKSL